MADDRCFEANYWAYQGIITPDYMTCHVMPEREANAIEAAADLAFVARFGEAEQARMRAGYHGLGLVDHGAVAVEAETTRAAFRQMLDEEDEEV